MSSDSTKFEIFTKIISTSAMSQSTKELLLEVGGESIRNTYELKPDRPDCEWIINSYYDKNINGVILIIGKRTDNND